MIGLQYTEESIMIY